MDVLHNPGLSDFFCAVAGTVFCFAGSFCMFILFPHREQYLSAGASLLPHRVQYIKPPPKLKIEFINLYINVYIKNIKD